MKLSAQGVSSARSRFHLCLVVSPLVFVLLILGELQHGLYCQTSLSPLEERWGIESAGPLLSLY